MVRFKLENTGYELELEKLTIKQKILYIWRIIFGHKTKLKYKIKVDNEVII